MSEAADVVVVGAGFAGLTAARDLMRLGHEVLVLEGRHRVGGRSHTGHVADIPVDLGATFVGPTQDAVLAVAAELGVPTVPTYHDGANLIAWSGTIRRYNGTIPRLSLGGLLDIARVRWQFERIARGVPLARPWEARRAGRLDAQSLGGWLASVHAGATARGLLAIVARVTWGCEPEHVSMLHAARYVAAAGGLDRLLDTEGGAQQDRFTAGTQQIADAMAAELGDRIILDAKVSRIDSRDGGLTVSWVDGRADARFVIVAIPPAHRTHIEFTPPLPAEYGRLTACWPQGQLSKAYAAYSTPFWRADGLSGQALSDEGPVFITFDVSPRPDGPGVLLGFVDARRFDELAADQRRRKALGCFAALFGPGALEPLDYVDQCWGAEGFAAGGPTAAVPPGSWTRYGPWLRRPAGPIHWAGTETADEWTGFLDGAVRAGQRAAAEVAARL
jgi:monoamine oxidase